MPTDRTRPTAALPLALALLCACTVPMHDAAPAETKVAEGRDGFVSSPPAASPRPAPTPAAEPAPAPTDRLMVFHGALAVEVARTDEAIAQFSTLVREVGGYVSQRTDATLTARIPAARFEPTLAHVRTFGRVLSESVRADDVTKQHTDLALRIDNARRARERLTELLGKASKIEDLLTIEKELRRLTEEIERMEGELKFLNDQVALATVKVEFRAIATPQGKPRTRAPSRFSWINRLGVEHVRRDF